MPGENCGFPKCSTSRKDKGFSLFKVPNPDKNNNQSFKWTKNLVDNTVKYLVKDESLIKRIQSYKLYIYERHFTPEQIYMYPISKMLNEGTLPALNLPREIASNTTKHRPTRQLRTWKIATSSSTNALTIQNYYRLFKNFTSRIFADNILNFTVRVHSWV